MAGLTSCHAYRKIRSLGVSHEAGVSNLCWYQSVSAALRPSSDS